MVLTRSGLRQLFWLPILAISAALGSPLAHAGILSDDEARKAILELRDTITESDRQNTQRLEALGQRIDDLSKRIEGIEHGQLDSVNRTDSTNQDVDKLRGVTEELRNEITNAQKRDKDRYVDLDARLRKLEPAEVTIAGHPTQIDREEQSSWDTAMAQVKQNNFQSAIRALDVFVGRYPLSVYAADAQFWLGNSYYAVKDFAAAITAHQFLMEHYPDSPHIPDALLNIAACQVELGNIKDARDTLVRITLDYPDSETARVAKSRLDALPADKEKDKPKAGKTSGKKKDKENVS